MPNVSVGQVENIEHAICGLCSLQSSLELCCNEHISKAEAKLTDVQQEMEKSAQLLEAAFAAEMSAQQQLEQANEQLASANQQLSLARSSLSSCQARDSYDKDGNYEPPDCSSEESDVAAAESDVAEAESAVAVAENALEIAKEQRMKKEMRNEMARQCMSKAMELVDTVRTECAARMSNVDGLVSTAQVRLARAKEALDRYLTMNPTALEFKTWLKAKPAENKPFTPKELHARLNLSKEHMTYYFGYLLERDNIFKAKICEYRRQLNLAKGAAERLAVQLKVRRNLSGYCGERIVEQALGSLGHKVDTQARTTFEDGSFTKTDLIIENLKVPVILGRGENMSAPIGGTIAFEVKCGRSGYIKSERDHMVSQAGGHQKADASVTLCSRDIKDLSIENQQILRETLRDAGSPIIGMLPTKEEIDQACWNVVTDCFKSNQTTHEN